MKMDEEWPDHFEEHSRPSRAETEEAGERKLDAMANMVARPQSLQDYLRDQLGWFEIEPALRAMCERIIYNLDTNGYLQGRLEDLLGLDATKEDHALAERALAVVQKLDPPGVAARNVQECLLLQLTPGMPYFEQLQTLITSHLEDLEHNRLPVISRRTGLFDRADPAGLGRVAEAQSQARGRVQQRAGPARHARRVRRVGRRRQVPGSPGRRPHAQPLHQPLLPQAVRRRAGERRDPRVHQAEDQLGAMADRFDPAAAKHARRASRRRSSITRPSFSARAPRRSSR